MPSSPRESALDELGRLLFPQIARTERLISQALAARLARHGMSLAQFRLVGALLGEPEGLAQTELAERLGIALPTLSVALAKLEAAGVVRRDADAADGRVKRVRATLAARQLRSVLGELTALEGETLAGISARDLDAARRVLRAIQARVEGA